MTGATRSLRSVEQVREAPADERALADRGLATAVNLAASLEQTLLLEGEAGVERCSRFAPRRAGR